MDALSQAQRVAPSAEEPPKDGASMEAVAELVAVVAH